jgi:hypothetical protein
MSDIKLSSRRARRQTDSDRLDSDDLAALGYRQQLHRRLGPYSSFAASSSASPP